MDRHPSDRILEAWDSVAHDVRRPAEAPRRGVVRGSFRLGPLLPLAAAAVVVAVGIAWLGGREVGPGTSDPAPTPSALAVVPSATATSTPSTSPTPTATPESTPSPEPCRIEVSIVSWEGAAGSRIAEIRATNPGTIPCLMNVSETAQLIDGTERVLAQTGDKLGEALLDPGDSIRAMVSVSNVCGEPPVAPVTIRFNFATGEHLDAKPVSADDATVPPCNGPGQPSDMSIRGWTR